MQVKPSAVFWHGKEETQTEVETYVPGNLAASNVVRIKIFNPKDDVLIIPVNGVIPISTPMWLEMKSTLNILLEERLLSLSLT